MCFGDGFKASHAAIFVSSHNTPSQGTGEAVRDETNTAVLETNGLKTIQTAKSVFVVVVTWQSIHHAMQCGY